MDISIVVAVYNEEKYLSQTLESLCNQPGVDYEIIVMDDKSTDNTKSIIHEFSDKYDFIKYIENPVKGKVNAFNYGISKAKGKYACLFAGDDIMPEGSLKARFNHVETALNDDTPGTGLYKIKTISTNKKFDGHIVPKKKGKGNPSGPLGSCTIRLLKTLIHNHARTEIAITKNSDTTNSVNAITSLSGSMIANSYRNADTNDIEATMDNSNPKIPNSSGLYILVSKGDEATTNI